MSNSNLPNTIIAGPPKCGTSSLFFWLITHPQVCGSKVKETWYFIDSNDPAFNISTRDNQNPNNLKKYKSFFQHCRDEKRIIEATPGYIYQKTALKAFTSFKTQPHMIFLLRKPSLRVFSLFRFEKYRRKILSPDTSFKDFLKEKKQQHKKDKINCIERSIYINYLKKWIKHFPRHKLLIYLFEDLKNHPKKFMKNLSSHINIDTDFWGDFDFSHRNKTVKIKNKALHNLGQKLLPYIPIWMQENLLFPIYYKLNATSIPPISAEEKEQLKKLEKEFKPHNEKLAQTFNLDISPWYKNSKLSNKEKD